VTRRATLRGAERTSLDGETADVLVCGASFGDDPRAGLC
jgi:hypothetical protein